MRGAELCKGTIEVCICMSGMYRRNSTIQYYGGSALKMGLCTERLLLGKVGLPVRWAYNSAEQCII